ncbi:hypothetical protein IG631_23360 [Alternaria alternata]|nr:hypothetical protein IG631_23360 [Alternaria alternata]
MLVVLSQLEIYRTCIRQSFAVRATSPLSRQCCQQSALSPGDISLVMMAAVRVAVASHRPICRCRLTPAAAADLFLSYCTSTASSAASRQISCTSSRRAWWANSAATERCTKPFAALVLL